MRNLSKALVVAVGLFSIGVSSSSVLANNALVGSFTLSESTQWKNTTLPAGKYTFKMARLKDDVNQLSVSGKNKNMNILVYAQSECEACRKGALQVEVQGDNRVVTSMELPGYHMNFNGNKSAAEREKQMSKAPVSSEQIAVHVDSNN
jgi:hypothetical protein